MTLYIEIITEIGDRLGIEGVAYSLIILLALVFLFVYSPMMAILASIVGVLVISLIGVASIPFVAVIAIIWAGAIVIATMRT